MAKKIDTNTRFYIDLDIKTKKIIGWDYDQRQGLEQKLSPQSSANFHFARDAPKNSGITISSFLPKFKVAPLKMGKT